MAGREPQTLLETVSAFTRPHFKSGEWCQATLGDVGLAVGHDDAKGIFFLAVQTESPEILKGLRATVTDATGEILLSEELPADGSYVRLKVNYTMKFPFTVTSSL